MGKSLVIKGADFSENGFTYKYVTLDVATLYYKGTGQASLVQDTNEWPVSSSDGRSFYSEGINNTAYTLIKTVPNTLVFKKYPIGDWTRVKIRTVANLAGRYIILAFLDSNDNMLGGFSVSTNKEETLLVSAGGPQPGYREFEMDVPEGTVNIIGGFYENSNGATSPFATNGFKVTLSKISED